MNNKPILSTADDSVYYSSSLIDYTEFLQAMGALCGEPGTQLEPQFILRQLLQCVDTEMLIEIADDPKTCNEILSGLAKIQNADVRFAMAENHNLDFNILLNLACDENPYVSMRAQRTIERQKGTTISEAAITLTLQPKKSRQVC